MREFRTLRPLLRRLRRRRGLTQAALAEALGLDIRTAERFASGRTRLELQRILELSAVLDCDPLGLVAALALESPAIAWASAEAKPFWALALALQRLPSREVDRLSRRSALEVIAACERLIADLMSAS